MHKELRDLLHSAVGQSRHVAVIFLDVRGFSSFAGIAESSDTAEFLKSAYTTILDDYFPDADFFKPTGDGLLILRGYDRESLTDAVRSAVDVSIRLVEDFPEICADDPMVNFDVPGDLGIGLARGAATSLTSGDKVLDFSGRPLNLASRLMDLARPSGVVFDGTFGYELLAESVQSQFSQEAAYIKGLAEDEPLTAYCLKGRTEIPEYNRSPMNRFKRHTESPETLPMKEWKDRGLFVHPLSRDPAKKNDIDVHLEYPEVRANGTKHPDLRRIGTQRAKYVFKQGKHFAQIDYRPWAEKWSELGIKGPWNITSTVEYSVVDKSNIEPEKS